MDLTIIIVNYNVKYFLEQALHSLRKSTREISTQFIVIDNASDDGSVEFLRENFPWVDVIANRENLGFSKANNQGLIRAEGGYILVVNPDTVVGEDTIKILLDFMDVHPDVGAIGPKLIDRGGKFELNSRRGFPTPFAAFCKISGLAQIFPRSRLFARYNLTYLDPDTSSEVDALTGAFILIRREVYQQVGGFDEDFFMYGEDLDWCYRIKNAGWKIYYLPDARVIHYGGESVLRSRVDTRRAFYQAMYLFIRKHFSGGLPLKIALLKAGVFFSASLSWLKGLIYKLRAPLIDLFIINLGLFSGRFIRFGSEALTMKLVIPFLVYNLSWIAIFTAFGAYSYRKRSIRWVLIGAVAGGVFSSAFTYFFKQFAYSRFVMLYTILVTIALIPGWRWLAFRLPSTSGLGEWFRRRTLLVGVDELTSRIAQKAQNNPRSGLNILGFIDPSKKNIGRDIFGRKVLGTPDELPRLAEILAVEEVIFSAKSMNYEEILTQISRFGGKVGFKVIPESALSSPNGEAPFLELGFQRKPRLLARLKDIP